MSIDLHDVIDIEFLQKLQDTFSNATGVAAISVSKKTGNLTKPSNFNDFCINKTRGCKEGLKRCIECDIKGGEESSKTGKPAVYYCHAGLMDFAVPIVIDGEILGSVVGGQVLPEPPDEQKFRKIAHELGIDENEYIKALRKIPIVSRKRIEAAAELLSIMVNDETKKWTQKYKMNKYSSELTSKLDIILKELSSLLEETNLFFQKQDLLYKDINNVKNLLDGINSVVLSVSKIADKTKLLGFNASIEAARASDGAGFGVVAKQIGILSEQSKKTVNEIEQFTDNIDKSIKHTDTLQCQSTAMLDKQSQCINKISNSLADLKNMFNILFDMIKQ